MNKHLFSLTDKRHNALLVLAARHNATSGAGRTAGEPSIRALVNMIADGRLRLSASKRPDPNEKRVAKKLNPKYPPKWWRMDLPVADACAASGLTVEVFEAAGFDVLDEPGGKTLLPPTEWRKWVEVK